MLKSQNRLKKDTDFSAVLKSGQRTNCGDFLISVTDNGLPESRVGVVVSKKVGGLAVRRNRIRRVALAELANFVRTGGLAVGKDIVIRFVKQPANLGDSTQLRSDIGQCLKKLSLL